MTRAVLYLIVANVVVFALQGMVHPLTLMQFELWPLGDFPVEGTDVTVGFAPWQLVTSAFMHGNFPHIALNMFALYMFGRDVELVLGTRRFCWLYGASVIAGSLAQLMVATATVDDRVVSTVGASGGVFGVLLAFGVLFPKRRVMLIFPPIPMPAWVLVAGYAVIELTSGVLGTQQGVAHFAHLGGMVGAAIVLLIASRGRGPPPVST
ncbi:MAG TPA: rhomboid family intramembrane serine protease [Steroidobacteraceae bacterium]|nr:rhomboid family intramembrane serine protease [Steroidobacteraceae bacterium]